jgi:repressor LexA
MNPLPPKQQAVLDFIRKELADKGRAPTVREIAGHFGWHSPHGVSCHLAALEKKGFIGRRQFARRGVRLTAACNDRGEN